MKKNTMANIIMVVIIAIIMIGGVLLAGNTLGWFDKTDDQTAILSDIRGVVSMHRDGVVYTVEKDISLRQGDILSCEKGASAKIRVAGGYLTLGEGAKINISNSAADNFEADIVQGEIFVNCTTSITVSFGGNRHQLANVAAHISVRTGTQSISIFSGSVEQAGSGQKLEYLSGEVSVSTLQIDALNDFTIAQLREANKTQQMHFSNEQLDALEQKRNDALQDIINGQTPTDPPEDIHIHAYQANIIAPSCKEEGYTEHICSCGDRYIDNRTSAKGHVWQSWITVKEPTTSFEGLEKRACANCQEIEERSVDKLVSGHTHSYKTKKVDPTCTSGGYTLHTCSCGVSYKDNETSATGHHYSDKVVAPTCTEDGYTVHTCSCGETYSDQVVKTSGHNWSDWEVVKKPTTSQTGLQKRSCKDCKTKQEETLPKLEAVADGYVYLTIRCDTILNNMEELNSAKAEFVPADGVILPRLKVAYTEGESVFDVLVRVCDAADIQLEYSWEPLYDAYYIEGINNLYHFDCGSESGWMYKVNEWFPNYGVSSYYVSDGDVIDFLYTCHGYGTDVGAPEWEG